jgi:hypothetical protein
VKKSAISSTTSASVGTLPPMLKKRNYILTLSLLLTFTTVTRGQNKAEFERHLNSIDSNFFPGHIIDRRDTVFNANRAFVDYTIKYLLAKPSDKYFISNRNLLPKLKFISCDSINTEFKDTLKTGEICHIKISTRKFIPEKNKIVKDEENDHIKSINGQIPYGGNYAFPDREIGKFEIYINGRPLIIPRNAYSNLFKPNICEDYAFDRRIEAYTSIDGKFIYVYIFGGEAAGTYYSKLIFDHEKYLTRIISDYYPLSIHGSFRKDFIGF